MQIPKLFSLAIVTVLLLSACDGFGSPSLDERCALLFEELEIEFLDIAKEPAPKTQISRLANLPQVERIFALERDINSWDWTQSTHPGNDDLTIRKIGALNAASRARFEVSGDVALTAIEQNIASDGRSAYEVVTQLFTLCNQQLR